LRELRPRLQSCEELKKRRVSIINCELPPGFDSGTADPSTGKPDSRKIIIVTHDSAQTDRSNELLLSHMKQNRPILPVQVGVVVSAPNSQ